MLNKYKKIYDAIIEKRKRNPIIGYSEKHHIIPKCLGGTDSKENIIRLTAREHYLCHYLLTKIYKPNTINYYKMVNAFLMMIASPTNKQKRYTSRLYEYNKTKYSDYKKKSMSGVDNHQYGKIWICNKTEKINRKICKDDDIPIGWCRGRNKWKKEDKIKNKMSIKNAKQNRIEDTRKKEYLKLYEQYIEGNYESIREFARSNHYNKSHVTLTHYWKKYIKNNLSI
jgi:hypothetical protein